MRFHWSTLIVLSSFGVVGCSSSILTDVPPSYHYLPRHTSFKQCLSRYRDHMMTFQMRDGGSTEGLLLDANRDSVAWSDTDSLRHSAPTSSLSYIQHGSNTIPIIIGTPAGFCLFAFTLGSFTGGGGMHGPPPVDPNQFWGWGMSGAALGCLIGSFIDVTDTYDITELSLQAPPDSSRTVH